MLPSHYKLVLCGIQRSLLSIQCAAFKKTSFLWTIPQELYKFSGRPTKYLLAMSSHQIYRLHQSGPVGSRVSFQKRCIEVWLGKPLHWIQYLTALALLSNQQLINNTLVPDFADVRFWRWNSAESSRRIDQIFAWEENHGQTYMRGLYTFAFLCMELKQQ